MSRSPCLLSEKGQNPARKLPTCVPFTSAAWPFVSAVGGCPGQSSESHPSVECVVIHREGHSIVPPAEPHRRSKHSVFLHGFALPPMLSAPIEVLISKIFLTPLQYAFGI